MVKIDYSGHRERIKEKYIKAGLKGLADYEKLEMMLFYSIPRKDTKPLAKKLLSKYKTLSAVLDADIENLQKDGGLSAHSVVLLKLFKDIAITYTEQYAIGRDLISSPSSAIKYIRTLLAGRENEEFYALFVDSSNKLIESEKIHEGIVNKAVVYPRKIAEIALKKKATGVIIAHNHPSGSLDPSEDDIRTTAAVKNALKTIDIALIDHIIISRLGYASFNEKGIL